MLVGICGGGLSALEMALQVLSLEGRAIIISKGPLGGILMKMAEVFPDAPMERPWSELTSSNGRLFYYNQSKQDIWMNPSFLGQIPTYAEFKKMYLAPLVEKMKQENIWKEGTVFCIGKEHLSKNALGENRKRILDLFSILYTHTLKKPEMEGNQVNKLEKYFLGDIDQRILVDMCVDARGEGECTSGLGESGMLVMGERKLKKLGKIVQAKDFVFGNKAVNAEVILIVGDSFFATIARLLIGELILKEKKWKKVIHLHYEENQVIWQQRQYFKEKLEAQNKSIEKDYEIRLREFEQKKKEWDELEDYIQRKIPQPKVPVPLIEDIRDAQLIGLDYMEDRKSIFATLDYKSGEIKVVAIDLVLNGSLTFRDGDVTKYLKVENSQKQDFGNLHEEPGFYRIKGDASAMVNTIEDQVSLCMDNILQFFRKG